MKNLILALLFVLLIPIKSWALFEFDLHLGIGIVNPTDYNKYLDTIGVNNNKLNSYIGVGLVFFAKSFPVFIGAKYDSGSAKEDSKSYIFANSAEYAFDRSVGLFGLRLYEGPSSFFSLVGGYGFAHSLKIRAVTLSGTKTTWDKATISSYNAAIITGYKHGNILGGYSKLALEVGYQSFVATDIKNDTGDAPFTKLDLTGPYIQLGFVFGI